MSDFSQYKSVFSYRYGSDEMRRIFGEEHKYQTWRRIWVALARAQHGAGLVSDEELADLEKAQDNIDIDRIYAIESETKHDVVAGIREFAEKAPVGGKKIHLGATSMDINDNADAVRIKEALALTKERLTSLLEDLSEKIEQYKDFACLGYTHLQPAEPTTIGYRLAFYGQDLLTDLELLNFVISTARTKGMKGAVGTQASYDAILSGTKVSSEEMESSVMEELGVEAALISTQVVSRKFDYLVLVSLASIASSLAKFAGDVRILQSAGFGEWSEPFGKTQVGSSAMPFKRNPISTEKICSIARYLQQLPNVAIENASLSYLERTLDDSANRRIVLPEAFLAIDEITLTAQKVIEGLVVNEPRVIYNLEAFAPFAATESILIEAVKNGADRQEVHELLREIAMQAWQEISEGKTNPMPDLLRQNKELIKYVAAENIDKLLDVSHHLGTAPQRAEKLARNIKSSIKAGQK